MISDGKSGSEFVSKRFQAGFGFIYGRFIDGLAIGSTWRFL